MSIRSTGWCRQGVDRRAHHDVVGDLVEAQVVVDRRAHESPPRRWCRAPAPDRRRSRAAASCARRSRQSTPPRCPPGTRSFRPSKVVQRVDRQLGVDQVHVVVDMADEIHAELLVELPRQLATAIGVEHHVPVVRVVQSQRIGAEEHTRRHATRPVDGEDVHPLEHAVAHRIHQLEIAGDGTRRKRLERQFAVGQVDHAAAPVSRRCDTRSCPAARNSGSG